MVLLATMRAHRAIETGLQWQPDLTLCEDAARHRKDNGPGIITIRRRLAPEVMRRIRRKAPVP
jgi:predicted transposase YbfD/YdcC